MSLATAPAPVKAAQQIQRGPSRKWAIAALILATVAISFAAILIRQSSQEIGASATVFNRLWIAALLMGLLTRKAAFLPKAQVGQAAQVVDGWGEGDRFYSWTNLKGLFIVSSFYVIFQMLWAWSLGQTTIAISTVLHNLSPLFTSLGAWLLLGQRFDRRFWWGMALALCGISLILFQDLGVALEKLQGDAAALLSAVFYGAYLIGLEKLRKQWTAATILFWTSAMGALLSLPFALSSPAALFPHSLGGWLAIIALAGVCHVLGQGMLVFSLSQLSSGFVALFLLLDPVLSALEAWIIFGEKLAPASWAAFAIVMLGIYFAISSRSIFSQAKQANIPKKAAKPLTV